MIAHLEARAAAAADRAAELGAAPRRFYLSHPDWAVLARHAAPRTIASPGAARARGAPAETLEASLIGLPARPSRRARPRSVLFCAGGRELGMPVRGFPPPRAELDRVRAARLASAFVGGAARDFVLRSQGHWAALLALWEAELHGRPLSPAQLRARLDGLSTPERVLAWLEANGHVVRVADPGVPRLVILRLSPAAAAAMRRHSDALVAALDAEWHPLAEVEAEARPDLRADLSADVRAAPAEAR
jgi:DNA-binding MarR family transcriptional regulator